MNDTESLNGRTVVALAAVAGLVAIAVVALGGKLDWGEDGLKAVPEA